MAHKITVGQLKALLNDGMGALGLGHDEAVKRGLVPQEFGREGYTAALRLQNVGLTFADLKEAGIGIQSCNHAEEREGIMSPKTVRLCGTPEQIKEQQTALKESYRAQHGGRSITPVCTGKTTPSGIVPYTPPEKARAAQVAQWTFDLNASLTGKADGELAVIPAVGETAGTGNLLPGVMPTTVGRPKATQQPIMYMAYYSAVSAAKGGLTAALANLQAADDQSQVTSVIEEIQEYITLFPESLSKVTQAAFDDKVIRSGVEVNLIQGTAAYNVATAALKRFGINVDPTTIFTVTGARMKDGVQKGWEYQPKGHEPLRNPLFAMIVEGQPSQLKRVVKAPPVVITWKAVAGELANFGPDQVIILDVTGDTASVYYLDEDTAERQGHELGEEGAFNCTLSALTKPV